MLRNLKKTVSLVLVCALSVIISIPAFAVDNSDLKASNSTTNDTSLIQSQENLECYLSAYNALYKKSTYSYDAASASKADVNAYYVALKGINDETFNDYFKSVRWITRDGVVSLSIQPAYLLTRAANPNGNVLMARASHAFSLLEDRFSGDYRWDHTDSMEAQFHCHVLLAGDFKTPWNIEPFRTESDLVKVMAAKCNPGGGNAD